MYLSVLNNEKKHLFLELEIYMAKTDGDFSQNEKNIIDAHCMEMHIDNNNYECNNSFDSILSELSKKCNSTEKRIIFFELAATVLADEIYDNSEKIMIGKLSEIFGISDADSQEAFNLINDMKSVYKRCANFINEV